MGMGMGLPPAKARDFGGSLRRLLGGLRPEAPLVIVVVVLAVISVTFAILGPKILGEATNLIFEGAISAQLPSGVTHRAGRGRPPRLGTGPAGRHALDDDPDARPGHRLRRARRHPARARRGLPAELALRLAAGVHHDRGHPADRAPAPRRRRGQAGTPAAAHVRQPTPRRPAEPRHQRHRQHRPVAPAEPDPADHVAAHDRRGPRDDVPRSARSWPSCRCSPCRRRWS